MISTIPVDRYLFNNHVGFCFLTARYLSFFNCLIFIFKINDVGLWYRCVLQLILKEKFNLYGVNIRIGKIAPKCRNFTQYVRKAIQKLQLPNDRVNSNVYFSRFSFGSFYFLIRIPNVFKSELVNLFRSNSQSKSH
jgi:hypothetical protein